MISRKFGNVHISIFYTKKWGIDIHIIQVADGGFRKLCVVI
jgi:hypothetical protein